MSDSEKLVMALGEWSTNADLFADVEKLGYISDNTLDLAYGLGKFWTNYRPDELVTNDLHTEADHAVDWLSDEAMAETDWEQSFDTVIFDPPYKLNGTPTKRIDVRYGVDRGESNSNRARAINIGLGSAHWCLKPGGYLLVKCQDQIAGGKYRPQMFDVFSICVDDLGMEMVDRFIFPSYRPQPAGRSQQHARRNHSELLVFKRR